MDRKVFLEECLQFDLKVAILKGGLTQRTVAAKAGIPEAKVSEIVRGWRDASEMDRARLAAAIGCSVEEAFGSEQRCPDRAGLRP